MSVQTDRARFRRRLAGYAVWLRGRIRHGQRLLRGARARIQTSFLGRLGPDLKRTLVRAWPSPLGRVRWAAVGLLASAALVAGLAWAWQAGAPGRLSGWTPSSQLGMGAAQPGIPRAVSPSSPAETGSAAPGRNAGQQARVPYKQLPPAETRPAAVSRPQASTASATPPAAAHGVTGPQPASPAQVSSATNPPPQVTAQETVQGRSPAPSQAPVAAGESLPAAAQGLISQPRPAQGASQPDRSAPQTPGSGPGLVSAPQGTSSEQYSGTLAPPLALIWPSRGRIIQSYGWQRSEYGDWRLDGSVVIRGEPDRPVYAVLPGVVVQVLQAPVPAANVTSGVTVILRHSNGWSSRYGPLEMVRVRPGESVEQGYILGFCREDLRFTLLQGAYAVNPVSFLP